MPGLATHVAPTDRMLRVAQQVAVAAYAAKRSGLRLPGDCSSEAAIFTKILAGFELGLPPMIAITNLTIEGSNVAMSARLKMSIVVGRMRDRGTITLTESSEERAVVEVRRHDWPDGRIEHVSYDMSEAKRAGLTGKDVWKKHPRSMLVQRAYTRAIDWHFQDASVGTGYTYDELGVEHEADEDAAAFDPERFKVEAPAGLPIKKTAASTPDAAPAAAAPDDGEKPSETGPEATQDDADDSEGSPTTETSATEPETSAAAVKTAPPASPDDEIRADIKKRVAQLAEMLGRPVSTADVLAAIGKIGFNSLKDRTALELGAILAHFTNLLTCEDVRRFVQITDDQWAGILQRKGAADLFGLTGPQAAELKEKLWERLTPFNKREIVARLALPSADTTDATAQEDAGKK